MRSEFSDGTTRIRPLGPDDADALFAAACESINEVYPWLEWCHPDYSRDEAASWLALREELWPEGNEYAFTISPVSSLLLMETIKSASALPRSEGPSEKTCYARDSSCTSRLGPQPCTV